jgi:hypothetical protein
MGYVIAFDLLQMYTKVFVSFCNNFFCFRGHAILYIQEVTKVKKGFYTICVGFDYTHLSSLTPSHIVTTKHMPTTIKPMLIEIRPI